MDESGDLGFDFSKRGTSKFFVVTLLYVQEKRQIEKIIRLNLLHLEEKQTDFLTRFS